MRSIAALLGVVLVAGACAQAAPVCPPPPPPAPCNCDLAPLASAAPTTIDDPLHPKDAGGEPVTAAADAAPDAAPLASAAEADAGPLAAKPPVGAVKPTAAHAAATPAPATPSPSSCGTKDNLCPLQKIMRGEVGAAKTGPAMAAAFTHTANLSPNGGWSWRAIALKGAQLAKAGDLDGAKAQCKACHDAYKAQYRSTYRARAVR